MSSRRRKVLRVLATVAGLYLACCLLACALHRKLLYFPHEEANAQGVLATWTFVRAPATDGEEVLVLLREVAGSGPILVYFHGNGETAGQQSFLADAAVREGASFASVEYRGYGFSHARRPTEAGLYADGAGALDALAARGYGKERVILIGFSLGTGVAVEMARRGRGRSLVLVAPFTSIDRVVDGWAPIFPWSLFVDRFDNLGKAPLIQIPTVVVHGDADKVVPVDMGRAMAAAIPRARLVILKGVGHNGWDESFDLVRTALGRP